MGQHRAEFQQTPHHSLTRSRSSTPDVRGERGMRGLSIVQRLWCYRMRGDGGVLFTELLRGWSVLLAAG